MKHLRKTTILALVAAALTIAALFTACDLLNQNQPEPGTTPDSKPTVASVTISPANAVVAKGGSYDFTAYVTGDNNPSQSVVWSVEQTNRQSGTNITSAGKLTVAQNETLAALTVIAVSTVDSKKRATATVTVADDETNVGPTAVTVTFNSNGGSAVDSQTIEIGTMAVEPPAPTRADHAFNGWFIDTAFNVLFNFYSPVNSDITIYAKWLDYVAPPPPPNDPDDPNDPDPITYTITFETNGGSSVASQTVAYGAAFSNPVPPTKSGYTFGGWYTSPSLISNYLYNTTNPVYDNITLYAKWLGSYTVTFNSNGGSSVPSHTVMEGSVFSRPTPPTKPGFTFGDWYTDNNTFAKPYDFSTEVNRDLTLYAKWVVAVPTDAATLSAYLSTLGPNSGPPPYTIKMDINDLTGIGAVIANWSGQIIFDFSGSTFTAIPDNAFKNCSSLAGMIIPNSVTSIGTSAFEGCSSLASINIPPGVTSIGSDAFRACSSLASINIPPGITSIGDGAFCYCQSLTSITIPNGVTSIGSNAFQGCSSLASINIPNEVTTIGKYAFSNCDSLTSVTIPSGVTSIGDWAFNSCDSLASATIPSGSIGESAFRECNNLASVTIGSGVTTIGDWAFWRCANLTSVTIQNGVTRIGSRAFEQCTNLASITIQNSVTSIGTYAFSSSGLTSVTIPNSVTSIGTYAFQKCTSLTNATILSGGIAGWLFQDCTSLTSVTIGNGVNIIAAYAFQGCSSLASITIQPGLTDIEGYAFYGCTSLTSITLPSSVTSVEPTSFLGCSSLASITVDGSNTVYSSEAGVLFDKTKIRLFACPNGKTGSYTIPSSVTRIERMAFRGCTSLTSLTIPSSVTFIGNDAFSSSSLTSVTFEGTISFGGYGESSFDSATMAGLRNKFYATDSAKGTPGTYTRSSGDSVWTKQP